MQIKNSVIIITGASMGIGMAAAKELSNKGAKVVLAARSADKLKALEKEIPGSFAVETDMRKPGDIKKLVDTTMKKFGRVDILINNAGQGLLAPVETIDIDDYKSIMDLERLFGRASHAGGHPDHEEAGRRHDPQYKLDGLQELFHRIGGILVDQICLECDLIDCTARARA